MRLSWKYTWMESSSVQSLQSPPCSSIAAVWSASVCVSRVKRTRVQAWRQNGHSQGSGLTAATVLTVLLADAEEEAEDEADEAAAVDVTVDEGWEADGAVEAVVAAEVAVEAEEDDGASFFFFLTNSFNLNEQVAQICSECGHEAIVWCSMGDTQIRQSGWTDDAALEGEALEGGCAADEADAATLSCDGSMLAADEGGSIGVGR